MGRRSTLIIACLTLLSGAACSGEAIVVNTLALLQTRLIQTTKSVGTAFVVNVDDREYWITAKHIFTGIENAPPGIFTTKTVQANILLPFSKGDKDQDKKWVTVTFTTIDPGKDIDILVLAPDHSLTKYLPPQSMKLASDADPADERALVPIGGDCDFLGYPYGSGWRASIPLYTLNKGSKPGEGSNFTLSQFTKTVDWAWSPFVKRCTLSASMVQNGITVFVLDGINNLGFSGGPVVTGNGGSLDVFAVISSFHAEPLEVLPAPEPGQTYVSPIPPPPPLPGQKSKQPKQVVESNSGLILAYDITPAIKAIHDNPIGPQLAVAGGNVK
jgi:hypothetical protein